MGAGEPIARSVAPCGLTEFQVLQRASVGLDGRATIVKRLDFRSSQVGGPVRPTSGSSYLRTSRFSPSDDWTVGALELDLPIQ